MIKHLFKYLLIVLLAGGFTACSAFTDSKRLNI